MSEKPVLHVISTTERRGAETFAVDLSARLVERGRASTVVALEPGRVPSLDVPALASSRFRGLARLRALANQSAVVIGHGSSTLPACATALLGARVPFVYRSIGSPRDWSASPFRRLRVTAFLRRAQRVVAIWPGAADAWSAGYGVEAGKVVVIPNGRPAAQFPLVDGASRATARGALGLDDDVQVALVLGALSDEKQPLLAVDAIARCDGVVGLFVGDGPQRRRVEAAVAEHLVGRGRVLGATEDPASVLAAADVVVLSSRTEGLPAVAIEAGLSGVPVVATDVGGTSEIVVDGVTGMLVPSGDARGLADGIGRALHEGRTLAAAARVRCLERFDLEVVVDQWERLLDGLAPPVPA